ncbi:transposase [Anaeromyxobacter oryzisoli]|uniref:transposase n=1 Tax=Anaeromyxobacter oryzisoli TaxID=2925408 RepID=UPI001F55ED96|nr:transposase [Anaeromyxobacter sp. SG63]
MTAPRQLFEGTTYLVTRRCSERRFFLRPSRNTDDIFRYVLAIAANRYEIQVHAFCVLSTHFHLVVTDPHARLPEFHRYLDGLVARAMNCSLGRWDGFWERDSYSAVRLETDDTVMEKMVHVLANPVAAGLVRRGREWPGLWSDPALVGGEPIVAKKPAGFFRKMGRMPASVSLQLHRPPGFEWDAAFAERLGKALRDAEDRAAAELAGEGRSFLGAARVLAQKPYARPAPGEPRRGLNPRVACRSRWKRIEALQRLEEFGWAYRKALESWRAGARDILFPPGTWLMRVQHAALCGEACG